MNEGIHAERTASELQDRVTELQDRVAELIEQQTAISEVLRAIASSPHDMQPIFDAILDSATRLCRADLGSLRLSEENGLRRVAVRGDPLLVSQAVSSVPEFAEKGSFLGGLATSRLPIHIPDFTALEGDHRDPYRIAAANLGFRAGLIVPLLKDNEIVGIITLGRKQMQPFTDKQNSLCNDFAAQATIVLESKRAEQTLRESEAKFRDYAETASDWFWEIGSDYKFTLLTENAFGAPAAHRLGTTCWDHALDLETEPEKWRLILATLDSRKPFRDFEYRGLSSNGSPVYVRASGKPVFDADGEFRGYRGTGTDITALRKVETEARESEQRYRKAQLELEHANRVATLGQLTSSIAHEVNQPITAAVTYALAARRYLSAEPPNFHEVDDTLSLIVKEGNRAAEVVSRIRALFKKEPARKDAVAINDAILEIVALTRTEAANNGVLVRTQLTEGLPRLQGDRVQLQQVLLNLTINAIEAMRHVGEEERELLISTRSEPDGVLVEVRDSGPGFAPEVLESVFEPFYTTKPEGMGMGLSICRSIIEAHGGRLWAIPCEPRGALFQFTIPTD
jgi:PAS domain S-box-containing protein